MAKARLISAGRNLVAAMWEGVEELPSKELGTYVGRPLEWAREARITGLLRAFWRAAFRACLPAKLVNGVGRLAEEGLPRRRFRCTAQWAILTGLLGTPKHSRR